MTSRHTVGEQPEAQEGVLIVHKEAGWTSHDVVAKVRALLKESKVGHAGTLDPSATGVLPILVGRATRIAEYLVDWDKEYRAQLRLGETTDTQDATGRLLESIDPRGITEGDLQAVLIRFQGIQRQLPPMYSAVKVGGQRLYRAARAGKTIDRTERTIVIHELELLSFDGRDATLRVVCSKGTYVRTLCADVGQALGVGGHLCALERSRVGPLSIEHALTINQVASHYEANTLASKFHPLDELLCELPTVVVNEEQAERVLHGAPVSPLESGQSLASLGRGIVRLKNEAGRLLAIGTHDRTGLGAIKVRKVLSLSSH